jgi:hypothetical protein
VGANIYENFVLLNCCSATTTSTCIDGASRTAASNDEHGSNSTFCDD